MPKTKVFECATYHLQILDEKGNVDESMMPKISNEIILDMYKSMVKARKFDEKLLALQRQGRIGTFAQVKGQEAQVAIAEHLNKDDWMVQSFREMAAALHRGVPMKNFILTWGGDERGNFSEESPTTLPIAIPVSSQTLHGAGIAWGLKLKGKKNLSVVFFGDGATSEGDFHEALNFASVFKVPCIFVCQNNQYAISVPVSKQTNSQTIAQKACAYNIPGIEVDGNDVFAMYSAMEDAVKRARSGEGPTLIEMFTYRLADHTTADDASKYRSPEEVLTWGKRDPISRLKKYITKKELWSDKDEEKLLNAIDKEIEQQVAQAEKMPNPQLEDMFKYMYKEMTPQLKEQLEYIKQFEGKYYK